MKKRPWQPDISIRPSSDSPLQLPPPPPPPPPLSLPPQIKLRFAVLQSVENLLMIIGATVGWLHYKQLTAYEWIAFVLTVAGVANFGNVLAAITRAGRGPRSVLGLIAFWSARGGL